MAVIPVRQRVHRVLRGMERFSAERRPPEAFTARWPDEHVFGVYETPAPHPPVVITERGLGVLGADGWSLTPYERMRVASIPQEKGKLEADQLVIRIVDGSALTLPMKPVGWFNDAYELLRFLDRVIDDRGWEEPDAGRY